MQGLQVAKYNDSADKTYGLLVVKVADGGTWV